MQSPLTRRERSPKTQAEAKDLERLQRATDTLPKVQDDLKAKVAVLEFQLAAKDVVDAIDSDAKIALRIKCDARERAAMRACPADLLFDARRPCRSINSIPERVRVAGGVV